MKLNQSLTKHPKTLCPLTAVYFKTATKVHCNIYTYKKIPQIKYTYVHLYTQKNKQTHTHMLKRLKRRVQLIH